MQGAIHSARHLPINDEGAGGADAEPGGLCLCPGEAPARGKLPRRLHIHYVVREGAADVHYVDARGKEISPQVALAAVGEHPASAVSTQQ